ncbi:DsbA family protein [Brevibacterium litoralis]|uniref:DsbA family protein n=1 Tax=Brevibacterium litoralis TaxID=3138935 RepID=UPI0032EFA605
MAKNTPSGPERRQNAREKARQLADEQARRDKLSRIILFSGLGLVVVAVALVITFLLVQANKPALSPQAYVSGGVTLAKAADSEELQVVASPEPGDAEVPAGLPTVADSGAQDTAAHLKVYLDFQCPACKAFEEGNGTAIGNMIADGSLVMELEPIAFLDSQSNGNEYSTRSANAFACVADSGQDATLVPFMQTLFANQPAEGQNGMEDAQLIALAEEAGVDPSTPIATVPEEGAAPTVEQCITEQTFADTVGKTTTEAMGDEGVSGTPTVLVNGEAVEGDVWGNPQSFATTLIQASS